MIKSEDFVSYLQSKNYGFFTGVPCSYFKDIINYIEAHAKSYYAAPNEGAALALASGAYLGGQGAVVMIQNSGLGNLINPLTSLSMIYKLPVLLFVSGRAYGIPDEPQHEIIGAKMADLLRSLGVNFQDFPQDGTFRASIDRAIVTMKTSRMPFVFFVHHNTFQKFDALEKTTTRQYPMKRIDAVKVLAEIAGPENYLFATTGMISRELFSVADRATNFYMQGSMGHIASVAMGAALSCPMRKIFVLDGDGAFLMHMGSASMVGFYKPKNFIHIVLDNESYETTGDQDTTSTSTDFVAIAKACSYLKAVEVSTETELREKMAEFQRVEGPVLLRVKINRLQTPNIPRITSKYQASQITENFRGVFSPHSVAPEPLNK